MKKISGFVLGIGLCLAILSGDAWARGFGGFRGGDFGGFRGGFNRFDGDRALWYRAAEDRALYAGAAAGAAASYSGGGWGIDECDDSNGGCGYDDGD